MTTPRERVAKLSRMRDFGSDRSKFVRLDRNERTIPFSEQVFQGMMATITPELLPMYPDQTLLYQKLAKSLGLPVENFLLTAGSDAAIKILYETYIEPRDRVVYLDPTYAMIDVYAELYGAEKVKVGYNAKLELDLGKLEAAIRGGAKMAVLANPNQPTGSLLNWELLEKLVKLARESGTLLVFDEAYQPFSGQRSAIELFRTSPHIMVLQSFSKAFGIASARLGYMVGNKQDIDYLFRVKSYADINLFALKLGEYLVEHPQVVQGYVADVKSGAEFLQQELSGAGFDVIPSHTNFLHIRLPAQANLSVIAERMKAEGYLVRISGVGLPAVLEGCIRITVGPLDQMKAFVASLKRNLV